MRTSLPQSGPRYQPSVLRLGHSQRSEVRLIVLVKLTYGEGDVVEDQRQVRSVPETDSSQLDLSPGRPARLGTVAGDHSRGLLAEVHVLDVPLQRGDKTSELGLPVHQDRTVTRSLEAEESQTCGGGGDGTLESHTDQAYDDDRSQGESLQSPHEPPAGKQEHAERRHIGVKEVCKPDIVRIEDLFCSVEICFT